MVATTGLYIALGVLIVVIPLVIVLVRHGATRRAQQQTVGGLTELAQQAGGRVVTDPGAATPRSEALRPSFREIGITGRSRPGYDVALDLNRGGRQVRVAQASMRAVTGSGQTNTVETIYEHRIEIAAWPSPALRILPVLPPLEYRTLGQTVTVPNPAQAVFDEEAPVGPQGRPWTEVAVPPQAQGRFRVFAEDQRFAAAVLGGPALDWLLQARLAYLVTLDQGMLYAIGKDAVDPATLPASVDLLVGLLDRLPPPPS